MMISRTKLAAPVALAMVLVTGPCLAQDFDRGPEAYLAEKYATAL